MIRTAVIGVGYLGRFHAQKYAQMEEVDLVGVVDISPERAQDVAREVGTRAYTDIHEIVGKIDAASVVVPTIHHHEVAKILLSRGIHCMLEKPISTTLEEADELISLAKEQSLILQVGHLERFNPAIKVLEAKVKRPLFIEAHRLSGFKDRATDVDVVLDLMIHDLEIILALVHSPLKEIRAVGVPVLTPKVDIANTRLIFENGCTANLTASRISLQDMRRIRVFQPGAYISADCAERKSLVVTRDLSAGPMAAIRPEFKTHDGTDMLYDELESFVRAVQGLEKPKVTGESGRRALKLAMDINARIMQGLNTSDLGNLIKNQQ
ncbi:MAG: Gfo/Idh/MocA family oxidoreductase [Deltaproteobacteria bacterium]|nr:Gfo/Idh/MocA family oxidoreductase [Deltaproteobacteria bacterium]MBW2081055.1 Gfo/Idh/MocA family oxidoreductase [Deltaproteobacteria bacterium]